MKAKKETFSQLIETFGYRYDLRTVFEDFLTMSICAVSHNPVTGMSHDEGLYMQTIAKYAKDELRHQFPKLFALLALEMEERLADGSGKDVLGEYFELNFCRKNSGQFFTPWHVCEFMAKVTCPGDGHEPPERPLRVLDPTCGSGRMLLAGAKNIGPRHEYYGVDIDHTCVKMTALNLFLNGVFHSEVMWADALLPNDFRMSYRISFLPFGIFRIDKPESSKLWRLMKGTHEANRKPAAEKAKPDIRLPSESEGVQNGSVSQLQLF
jgi:type I restriction-modification system DNA methylase subunit